MEKYVLSQKHLPNLPTAEEMKKNGIQVGDLQIKMLQKIEEMTLYLIQQRKQINMLQIQNQEQQEVIDTLRRKTEE